MMPQHELLTWAEELCDQLDAGHPSVVAFREALADSLSDPGENTVGKHHAKYNKTEQDAAYAVFPNTGTWRLIALDAFYQAGDRGLNDVELSAITGGHFQTMQPRRHELERGGWIVRTDEERIAHKKMGAVYVMPIHARRAYTRHEGLSAG